MSVDKYKNINLDPYSFLDNSSPQFGSYNWEREAIRDPEERLERSLSGARSIGRHALKSAPDLDPTTGELRHSRARDKKAKHIT